MFKTALTTLSLCLAGALAVSAQSTYSYGDPISAEILPGWQLEDGRRVVGLRLELEPGWKTYWRAPGAAGIPPLFDWRRARNVADVAISWPTPAVHDQNGMQSIGYTDVVVIPMFVTPKVAHKPVRLRGNMDLGVCADVCMPHQLSFDTMVDTDATKPTPVIAAALADTPYSGEEAGLASAVCKIKPTDHGLALSAHLKLPHTGGREVAVIETATPGVWVSEATTDRQGDTLIARAELVHENGGAFALDRSAVRVTVLGGEYAVDVQGCTAR